MQHTYFIWIVLVVFLFLTYHTMGQFSKLTEGFDQTKNSWVACGSNLNNLWCVQSTLLAVESQLRYEYWNWQWPLSCLLEWSWFPFECSLSTLLCQQSSDLAVWKEISLQMFSFNTITTIIGLWQCLKRTVKGIRISEHFCFNEVIGIHWWEDKNHFYVA
jgi:hypothetical protein